MLTQDNQKNIGSLSRLHAPVPMLHAHVPTETFKKFVLTVVGDGDGTMATGRWQQGNGDR